MPVFLLKLATGIGIPPRFAKAAVIAAAAVLLALAILAAVKIHDRRVVAIHEAKQDATNAKADRQADASAAEQRRADDTRSADEIQQVKEAIHEAGNDPAARRAAYYECVRKQQLARAKRQQSPQC